MNPDFMLLGPSRSNKTGFMNEVPINLDTRIYI